MRKFVAASTLFVAAAATLAGASGALADGKRPTPMPTDGVPVAPLNPQDDDDYAGIVISDGDSAKERRAHHELDLRYGKGGAFQIPPLVIKPGTAAVEPNSDFSGAAITETQSSNNSNSSINQTGAPTGAALKTGVSTKIANQPVDFSKVILNQESPAETFVHSSSIALIVLASCAFGAGGYLAFARPKRAKVQQTDEEYSA